MVASEDQAKEALLAENERLKSDLKALQAAERQRIWDATPDDGDPDPDDEVASAPAVEAPDAADDEEPAPGLDSNVPAATPAISPLIGTVRTVRVSKPPGVDLGLGIGTGRGKQYVVVEFVKKNSLLRGQIKRGETIWKVNGEVIECRKEAECRELCKQLRGLSGTVSLRVKPAEVAKAKTKKGGCCGAARVLDGSSSDSEEDEDMGFGGADDDGDGMVSRREMLDQLDDAGLDVDEADAARLIAALDTDGDGMLSAEEYARMDADGDGTRAQ